MRKKRFGFIIINLLLVVLIFVVSNLNKADLIISVGLVAANFLLSAGQIIAWLLLAAFNIVSLVRFLKGRRPKAVPAGQPAPKPWEVKISDPKEIRQELRSMQDKRPDLREFLGPALEQMDNLGRKQARLDDVLRRDVLAYGEHALKAVENAENVLCNNFVKILNYADLCDPLETSGSSSKRHEQHKQKMTQLLGQNAEVLDKCGELISKTVNYGDGKTGRPDTESMGIITTLDALNYLLARTGRNHE